MKDWGMLMHEEYVIYLCAHKEGVRQRAFVRKVRFGMSGLADVRMEAIFIDLTRLECIFGTLEEAKLLRSGFDFSMGGHVLRYERNLADLFHNSTLKHYNHFLLYSVFLLML